MKNWFLSAKPWKLFGFIFFIPILFLAISIALVFTWETAGILVVFFTLYTIFPVLLIIPNFLFLIWIWNIKHQVSKLITQTESVQKRGHFNAIFLTGTISYFIYSTYICFKIFKNFPEIVGAPNTPIYIFPLILCAIICITYSVYLTAKTIRAAELERAVKFSDFSSYFIGFLFYFVGIWFIQPKINILETKLSDYQKAYTAAD